MKNKKLEDIKNCLKRSTPLKETEFPYKNDKKYKKLTEDVCEIDRQYLNKIRLFGFSNYHREAVKGEWPNDHKINSVHVVEYCPGLRTRHPYYDPKYKKGGIKINKLKKKLKRSISSFNN